MKHIFLGLFLLGFTLALLLGGLLVYYSRRRRVVAAKMLGSAVLCLAGFAFFWYASSYLVVNVEHRVTLLYTSIEAVAIGFVGGACYFWLRGIMLLLKALRFRKLLRYSLVMGTAVLIVIKYSSHFPVLLGGLRAIKIGVWVSMTTGVMAVSGRLLWTGVNQHEDFVPQIRRWIGLGGLLLPVAGLLDYFVIYDKFYEGSVRLSLNTPLFISGFLIFGTVWLLLLIRELRFQPPQAESGRRRSERLEDLVQQYQITARETEVIKLVLQGKNNQEIAKALVISPATVKNHLHHIFQKMNLSNRYELLSLIWQEDQPQ